MSYAYLSGRDGLKIVTEDVEFLKMLACNYYTRICAPVCGVEPRAGFDPAACCLRGSRSTRLSHRGTILAYDSELKFLNVSLSQQKGGGSLFVSLYLDLLGKESLSDEARLGEHEIIKLIHKHLTPMPDPSIPFGDDVSAVPLWGEGMAVLKTDMLVGSTDIPPGMSLFAAARKAIVMNVSDFASKGVMPTAVLVALGLPKELTTEKAIIEITKGLNAGAREYGAYIIGGDTNETSELIVSISLFGTARNNVMLRSGARNGDILAVTGLFGKTSAGLHMLLQKSKASPYLEAVLEEAVFNPKARLREGLALRGYDFVSASMDSSDGLAWSTNELSRVNNVGFCIDKLPIAPEAQEFAALNSLDPVELALYGGEEYELVLTIKPGKWAEAQTVIQTVGGCLIPVGKATFEKQVILEYEGKIRRIEPRGWEHFKSRV